MVLHLTCPYTSQQNRRAERVLHTLNDSLHTMLLHAGALLSFWPDALATATYLLNHRSCCTHNDLTPYQLLLGVPPDYSHLRVFGCHCYPNTTATTLHKLATHSLPCIFVGYLADSKGYRCYDPESRRVLTSRHVLRRVMFSFQVTQLSTTGKSRRAYGAHWHRSGAHVDVCQPTGSSASACAHSTGANGR
jgi:hypothetical protein